MCGRYNLRTTPAQMQEFFDLFREPEGDWSPRYNIAPTQSVAAVRQSPDGRDVVWLHWGLIPFWTKDASSARPLINAKAETVAEKPSFRAAFKRRRCLIPATGFYEWKKTGGRTKQPYHIHRPDDGLFAFAGLWERWDKSGEPIESCTILTTDANELMADIHDRMPVILHPDDYATWLDPDIEDADELQGLLVPAPADDLTADPISTYVNNPRHESSECLNPP